jgi:hypothetical protein
MQAVHVPKLHSAGLVGVLQQKGPVALPQLWPMLAHVGGGELGCEHTPPFHVN